MTEITRLGLATTDQMKSDFISSISHELRSPLHGILGSAELLLEESMTNSQRETLGMITKCGKSLLDTMDHILVASKINAITKDRQSHLDAKFTSLGQTLNDGGYESHSTFDLASLVEDTVESTVVGREFSNHWLNDGTIPGNLPAESSITSASVPDYAPPSVILSIDGACSWLIQSEAGAWRRILMNLVGNALKYTTTGFVEIALRSADQQTHHEAGETQGNVSLSVKDSGRGIGTQYLRNHLYTAFSQENPLSSGAGLGLNIVHQLVSSLQGKIDVQSEIGWGTCFVVSIPVTFQDPATREVTVTASLKPRTKGRTLCLLALDLYPELEDAPTGILSTTSRRAIAQKTAIMSEVEQWFGMNVVSAQTASTFEADVIMVEENKLNLLWPHGQAHERAVPSLETTPVIVLCSESTPAHHDDNSSNRIHYLTRPIGPHKLAKALSACLDEPRARSHQHQPPVASLSPERTYSGLRVPLAPVHEDPNPPLTPTRSTTAELAQRTKTQEPDQAEERVHLLLVDDNAINLRILVACVKKLSCTYQTATNGLEALKLYESSPQHFDFVFMDISMPIMDGYASTRAIRAYEAKVGLRPSTVIAVSGLGSIEAQREGQLSGIDLFLTKPLPMQRIKKIVEREVLIDTAQRSSGAA